MTGPRRRSSPRTIGAPATALATGISTLKNAAAIDILSQPTAIESFALATDAEFDTDIFKKGEKQRHSRAFEVYKGRTGINAPDLEEEVEDTFEQDLNDILNEESI